MALAEPLESLQLSEQPTAQTRPAAQRLSKRAVAVGFLLLPLNTYWIGQIEGVWHGLHMTVCALPMNALLLLIILVGMNQVILRIRARWAFSQAELLTTYMMLLIQSVFIGHDNLIALHGVMPAAAWYNTSARQWDTLFFQYLPDWLVVKDWDAVKPFYLGGYSFYGSPSAFAWFNTLPLWTAIIFLLFVMVVCLNVLISKQWAEKERLAYPLVQLPLEITRGGAPPFLQKSFWFGFGIAAAIDLLNGLHYLYPNVPHLRVKELDASQYLTDPPWNAIGSTPLRFYPFVIGFAYLLPLDLCNSAWIFYLFGKLQRIAGSTMGWFQYPRFPFQGEQAAGGAMAVCLIALWMTRGHLKEVLRKVFLPAHAPHLLRSKGAPTPSDAARTPLLLKLAEDRAETRLYRVTFALFILCGVTLWMICRAAGMSGGIFTAFFILYFIISVAVTRIRAEIGPPAHSMLFVNPQDILLVHLGAAAVGPQNLSIFALFWWFNRLNRNHPMPAALECFRMSELAGISKVKIWALLSVVALFSILSCFFIYPALFYRDGAVKAAGEVLWVGQDTFLRLDGWLRNVDVQQPNHLAQGFMVGGFGFALLLGILRTRFMWFSLHPMGYVLGLSYAVDFYWISLVVTSVIKTVLLRYGGAKMYRQALPFFIGLIIGECIVACSWSLLALALHKPMYDAWW